MTQVRDAKLNELTPDAHNANKGTERGRYMLDHSLRQYGAGRSILVDKHGKVIAGNKTLEAAADIGLEDMVIVRTVGDKLVVVQRDDLDLDDGDDKARLMAYADNRAGQIGLEWDAEALRVDIDAGLDLGDLFTDFEFEVIQAQAQTAEQRQIEARQTLTERFVVPPFSVLDARQGYWQERKRAWLSLGIESELGRGEAYPGGSQRPAASLGADGRTVRGDGRGRAITQRERE